MIHRYVNQIKVNYKIRALLLELASVVVNNRQCRFARCGFEVRIFDRSQRAVVALEVDAEAWPSDYPDTFPI